jgi:hypothetical protein
MRRSTGALQVFHLGTCYSLRAYPGRSRTLRPRGPLVHQRRFPLQNIDGASLVADHGTDLDRTSGS